MLLVPSIAAAVLATAASLREPAPEPAPGPAPPLPAAADEEGPADGEWTGSVNVGANVTSGNSETTTFAASADATMKDGPNRYVGKAFYNFTEDRGLDSATQDNRGLEAEYNRFFSERLYGLGQGSYYVDEVIDLDARTTIGVGVGYQFYEREDFTWNAELGASQVDEDYEVDADDADYVAARLASGLGWQVNEQVRYAQDFTGLQSLDDGDDYILTNDSRVNVTLSESMVGTLQYVLDYDNTPSTGFERADHRFVLTVGWTF